MNTPTTSAETATSPPLPTPDRVIPYKEIEEKALHLHVFLPTPAPTREASDAPLRPVLVFFHGGGWNGGTPQQFFRQSEHFRSRGMICVSVQYRLKNVDGTSPFDAVRDAFDAMRFVKAHAENWGGDPTKIGAGGGSAGGHLAAATATLTAEDLAGTPEQAEQARPDLLLLLNPVSDNGPEGGYGHERVQSRWKDISPAHNLHAGVPPTLILLGDQDRLIPVETAKRLTSGLDRFKIPNRLVIYPGATHGFFNTDNETGNHYTLTLQEMDRFLVEHGWLPKVTAP